MNLGHNLDLRFAEIITRMLFQANLSENLHSALLLV